MDLSVIPTGRHSHYSAEQVAQAALAYVIEGRCTKVEEITGIPERTVNGWTREEWWPALIDQARLAKQDEVDAGLQRMQDKAIQASIDRLEHGDYIMGKDGQLIRKPVSAKDAAVVAAVAFDKQRIIRNLPTSITASGGDSRLNAMADRLKEIERRQEARVIPHE